MKKILFIRFQESGIIPDGGDRANERNISIAETLFGKDNIDCYYIHRGNKRQSMLSVMRSVMLFPLGYYNGVTPSKIKEIIELSYNYEYVFLCTSLLGIIAKKLKEHGYEGKVLTHFHNVESVYYESRAPKWLPGRQVIIRCAFKNDRYSLMYSDRCMALNRRDADLLLRLHGKAPEFIIPITFEDKAQNSVLPTDVLTGKRPKCLFVGNNFPANVEGLLWFVKKVLPHVDIDFEIVGKEMDKLQSNTSCLKSIKVSSNVPDLAPYFESADFMIYPIFSGSGMKVKTCEALMYGKNILGTTETFEGYDLDTDRCGRLCNSADEYISCIKELCENPIPRYNSYSRAVFLEKYSMTSAVKAYGRLLQMP